MIRSRSRAGGLFQTLEPSRYHDYISTSHFSGEPTDRRGGTQSLYIYIYIQQVSSRPSNLGARGTPFPDKIGRSAGSAVSPNFKVEHILVHLKYSWYPFQEKFLGNLFGNRRTPDTRSDDGRAAMTLQERPCSFTCWAFLRAALTFLSIA